MADDEDEKPEAESAKSTSAWLYLLVLAIPGILSILVGLIVPGTYGLNALIPVLLGCPLAGIIGGVMFAADLRKQSRPDSAILGALMAMVFTIASAGIAYGGCFVSFGVMR